MIPAEARIQSLVSLRRPDCGLRHHPGVSPAKAGIETPSPIDKNPTTSCLEIIWMRALARFADAGSSVETGPDGALAQYKTQAPGDPSLSARKPRLQKPGYARVWRLDEVVIRQSFRCLGH